MRSFFDPAQSDAYQAIPLTWQQDEDFMDEKIGTLEFVRKETHVFLEDIKNLKYMNLKILHDLLLQEFYNIEHFKVASKIMNSVFNKPELREERPFVLDFVELVSESTAFGKVLLTGFMGTQRMMVLKKLYEQTDYSLEHEASIGIELNALRKFCPNFCYTYTMFKCFPESDNLLVSPCNNQGGGSNDTYLAIEHIPNSVALFDFIQDQEETPEVVKLLLLQMFLALLLAKEKIGFKHHDLHLYNILVRRLNRPIQLEYYGIRFTTKHLLVFIDFGASSTADASPNAAQRYVVPPHILEDFFYLAAQLYRFEDQDFIFNLAKEILEFFTVPNPEINYANYKSIPYNFEETLAQFKDYLLDLKFFKINSAKRRANPITKNTLGLILSKAPQLQNLYDPMNDFDKSASNKTIQNARESFKKDVKNFDTFYQIIQEDGITDGYDHKFQKNRAYLNKFIISMYRNLNFFRGQKVDDTKYKAQYIQRYNLYQDLKNINNNR